jgi:hypothetical protein
VFILRNGDLTVELNYLLTLAVVNVLNWALVADGVDGWMKRTPLHCEDIYRCR